MTFDITEHPLLSPAAAALAAPTLEAQGDLAERLLGIAGASGLNEVQTTTATLAVVMQVNYQVEAGVDAAVYTSDGRGARSKAYRDLGVHPYARALIVTLPIAAAEASAQYDVLISRRTGNASSGDVLDRVHLRR